jgi:hypothetical protein
VFIRDCPPCRQAGRDARRHSGEGFARSHICATACPSEWNDDFGCLRRPSCGSVWHIFACGNTGAATISLFKGGRGLGGEGPLSYRDWEEPCRALRQQKRSATLSISIRHSHRSLRRFSLIFNAISIIRRIASDRDGWSGCSLAHSSTRAVRVGGIRKAVTGSCPVAGRPPRRFCFTFCLTGI